MYNNIWNNNKIEFMKKIRDIIIILTLIFIGGYFIFWENKENKVNNVFEISKNQRDKLETYLNQTLEIDKKVKEMIDWVKSWKMKYDMKEIQLKNEEFREYYKKNIENNDDIPLSTEKWDVISSLYIIYKDNDSTIKNLFDVKDEWDFTVENEKMEQLKTEFKQINDYLTRISYRWFVLKSEFPTIKLIYNKMLSDIDSMWKEQKLKQDNIDALKNMVKEKIWTMYKDVKIIDDTN